MQEVVKEKVIFAVNCGRQSRCPNTIRTKQKKKSVIISRAIDIEKSPLKCGEKEERRSRLTVGTIRRIKKKRHTMPRNEHKKSPTLWERGGRLLDGWKRDIDHITRRNTDTQVETRRGEFLKIAIERFSRSEFRLKCRKYGVLPFGIISVGIII